MQHKSSIVGKLLNRCQCYGTPDSPPGPFLYCSVPSCFENVTANARKLVCQFKLSCCVNVMVVFLDGLSCEDGTCLQCSRNHLWLHHGILWQYLKQVSTPQWYGWLPNNTPLCDVYCVYCTTEMKPIHVDLIPDVLNFTLIWLYIHSKGNYFIYSVHRRS